MKKFFKIYSRRLNRMLPLMLIIGAVQWIVGMILCASADGILVSISPPSIGRQFSLFTATPSYMMGYDDYVALGIVLCVATLVIAVSTLRYGDIRNNMEFGVGSSRNVAYLVFTGVVIALFAVVVYLISWLSCGLWALLVNGEYIFSGSIWDRMMLPQLLKHLPMLFVAAVAIVWIVNCVYRLFVINKISALTAVGINILLVIGYMLFNNLARYFNFDNTFIWYLESEAGISVFILLVCFINLETYALVERYADISR